MTARKDTKYNRYLANARTWYAILQTNTYDAMERMHNDGMTYAQIGRYFEVSAPNVHQIIKARRFGRNNSDGDSF